MATSTWPWRIMGATTCPCSTTMGRNLCGKRGLRGRFLPWSVALGDLDGMATSTWPSRNRDSNNVSVLNNNGDGTFAPKWITGQVRPNFGRAGGPGRDGDLDWPWRIREQQRVRAQEQRGRNLAAKVNYATGSGPISVAMGTWTGMGTSTWPSRIGIATMSPCSRTTRSAALPQQRIGRWIEAQHRSRWGTGRGWRSRPGRGELCYRQRVRAQNDGDGSFYPKVDYAAGSNPSSVSAGGPGRDATSTWPSRMGGPKRVRAHEQGQRRLRGKSGLRGRFKLKLGGDGGPGRGWRSRPGRGECGQQERVRAQKQEPTLVLFGESKSTVRWNSIPPFSKGGQGDFVWKAHRQIPPPL